MELHASIPTLSEPIVPLRWLRNGSLSYSQRISKTEWEQHRLFITFLHHGGMTRFGMLRLLQICKKFMPSAAQLNAKLGVWQLKVYNKSHSAENNTNGTRSAHIEEVHRMIIECNGRPFRNPLHEQGHTVYQNTPSLEALPGASEESSNGPFLRHTIMADALLGQDHAEIRCYDILADAGQLLHACRLFPEAQFAFEKSYMHVRKQVRTSHMRLNFCEVNCLRVATPSMLMGRDGTSNIFDDLSVMKTDVATRLLLLTSSIDTATAADNDYQMLLSQISNHLGVASSIHVSQDRADTLSPSANSSSEEWVLRQSDLIWRCTQLRHPFGEQHVAGIVLSWIADLGKESCRVWSVLRECLDILQRLDGTEPVRSSTYADFISLNTIYQDAGLLGCFFARTYLRKVLFETPELQSPSSEEGRLVEVVFFKLTVKTYFVLASLIMSSGSELNQHDQTAPTAQLISRIQEIFRRSPECRASAYLQVEKDIWYVKVQERIKPVRRSLDDYYVMGTAELLAEASVHMERLTKYTWKDPILGKRTRPSSILTHSLSSTASMRNIAKRIRIQDEIVIDSLDADEVSDLMSVLTIDPDFRFSAVTGLASNCSWQPSMSDMSVSNNRFSSTASRSSPATSSKMTSHQSYEEQRSWGRKKSDVFRTGISKCPVCGARFRCDSSCKHHIRNTHSPNVVWVCGASTSATDDVSNKLDSVPSPCCFCSQQDCHHRFVECWSKPIEHRTFFRQDNFKQHLVGTHNVDVDGVKDLDLHSWKRVTALVTVAVMPLHESERDMEQCTPIPAPLLPTPALEISRMEWGLAQH